MKRLVFILLILTVAALVGYKVWPGKEQGIPAVKTVVIKRGQLEAWIEEVGRLKSSLESTIFAETSGLIERVLVNEGDQVKRGSRLVRFDLREAKSNLTLAENRMEEARIEHVDAQRELDRTKELYEAGAASRLKLEADQTRYNRACIQVSLAEEGYSLAELQLSKLKAISPQSGVVVKREVKDGQSVQPGQVLFVVADLTNLEVEVEIDEVDAPQIEIGQPAIITSEGMPGHEFKGKVVEIAPQAKIKERTTVIRTVLSLGPSDRLKIGNQVDVRIITDKKTDILILPLETLVEEGDKRFVFFYSQGIAQKREITTGISSLEEIEVISGLEEGDEVIVPAGLKLKDGERVRKAD